MSPTTEHPTDVALAAYALGKLNPAKADTVRAHLEACATCRIAAEATPADTFLRLLRLADGPAKAETPAPSVAVTGVQPPQPTIDDDDTPQALRDHPVLKVQKLLGRGGMGAVYLAHHAMLDVPVAVKVMAPELVADEKSVARFHGEIRAVAKLNHPNIVRALDGQTAGGLHLFVMEYVDGQRLDEVVAARGRLPVDYACKCARLAALGLQHAHETGLAHRDFKPQNLMLSKTGQVKILDFGLAKLATASKSRGGMTSQGVILGTPEYMAPEQARDTASAGAPADVYALGATLFFLLTGRPPFTGATAIDIVMKQLNDALPRVTDLRPDVPAGLADLIARMLAKDVADRPPTAKAVAEALGPYTTKAATPQRPSVADANPLAFDVLPSLTTSMRRPVTRRRWPRIAGVFAALCGIGLTVTAAVVFRVKTADGTIVVTVNEKDAEVFVDGERVEVRQKGEEPIEIRRSAGKHTLEVKKGGFKVVSQDVTLTAGGREPVTVRLVRGDDQRPPVPDGDKSNRKPETSIDLVKMIDPKTHAIRGNWKVIQGTLISPASNLNVLQLPYEPPDEYRLEIVCERMGDGGSMLIGIVIGGHQVYVNLDGWTPQRSSLTLIDGKQGRANETTYNGLVLDGSRPNNIVCTVVGNGVVVTCNDKKIIDWKGNPNRLSVDPSWAVPHKRTLSIGSYSSFHFTKMTITPISGQGKRIED